jgi:iron-sulfur cluster repair protein YtfE (RIC family)
LTCANENHIQQRVAALRSFEHSHGELTKMALEVRQLVHAEPSAGRPPSRIRRQLAARLESFRDALLEHFANEEEALFPFIRARLPAKAAAVDRLHDAHDAIGGTLLRLAHLVERERHALDADRSVLRALYDRFEHTYTLHSQAEAALFAELSAELDAEAGRELAEILRGL